MTLALCVNPPVEAEPLPYIPVNVRLYAPLGLVLLVCTVTALLALLDPLSVIEADAKLHVEPDGSPVQESEMVPPKPFSGVNATL